VFVTKYRRACLTGEILDFIEQEFARLLADADCELVSFNGEDDHVHTLIALHPSIEPAKLINTLKTVSSRLTRKHFDDHLGKFYWGTRSLWSRSYCLLSVGGAPIEVLKEYIENQDRPS
jgi:putative transposase